MDFLAEIDKTLFLFINGSLANPVTDFLMPLITNDTFLRLLYASALLLLFWKGDCRLRKMIVASIIVMVFTDQIAAGILKPLIGRLRPCHELADINLLVNCGAGKAMPSAHAANAFGQAAVFGALTIPARKYLWGFASLVALSRVFVGVHYPADIFVGMLVGILVGLVGAYLFTRFETRNVDPERVKE